MSKKHKIGVCLADRIMYAVVAFFMIVLLILVLYPLVYVVSSSFSSGAAVSSGKVLLFPVDFSLVGYRLVLSYPRVWTGYLNSIIYTVGGTALNMLLTIMAAYPLSRRKFRGKRLYTLYFMITMFFSGGIIPTYILMSRLGLTNTRWAILLTGTISVYNMIVMRTFFQNSIPQELFDAARIDGVSDVGYLLRIVLPLSKAVLAVIILYYAVAHWNSYFDALMYLRNRELHPLQIVLRDLLNAARIDASQITDSELMQELNGSNEVMKYSLIVVSALPVLVAYPFVQKFFQKGIMVGSVKG